MKTVDRKKCGDMTKEKAEKRGERNLFSHPLLRRHQLVNLHSEITLHNERASVFECMCVNVRVNPSDQGKKAFSRNRIKDVL